MTSTFSARSRAHQYGADNGAPAQSADHSGPARLDPVDPVEFVEPESTGEDSADEEIEQPAQGDRSTQGMRRLRTPFTPEFTGTFADAA